MILLHQDPQVAEIGAHLGVCRADSARSNSLTSFRRVLFSSTPVSTARNDAPSVIAIVRI